MSQSSSIVALKEKRTSHRKKTSGTSFPAPGFFGWFGRMTHDLKHRSRHTQTNCPKCGVPLEKGDVRKTKRLGFFCNHCQTLFTPH